MTDSRDLISNTLPPLRAPHERKTFATPTLKLINSRLQYYRSILSQPDPTLMNGLTPRALAKSLTKRERIKNKYIRDMKVRNLLNKAIKNLYIK